MSLCLCAKCHEFKGFQNTHIQLHVLSLPVKLLIVERLGTVEVSPSANQNKLKLETCLSSLFFLRQAGILFSLKLRTV